MPHQEQKGKRNKSNTQRERAMEKGTEVEMQKISTAEKREDGDSTKATGQDTTDGGEEANEDKENVYCTLVNPAEDSNIGNANPKYHEDVDRRVRLYRIISAVLLLLCALLLVVVLALAVKLSEVQTKQECIDVERTNVAEVCNRQKCEEMYPREIALAYNEHLCSECGKGWLKFESSCYFVSNHRLTWQESREQCQKWGGDLVVISNERVQTFLTEKGPMLYWIGLRDLGREQWTWINNTAVIQSYWNEPPTAGHCALLRGWKSPRNNWISNPCVINSHYICQRG